MAAHSSIPAWRIPWTEEPGGLQSIGSQRVGHTSNLARMHLRDYGIAGERKSEQAHPRPPPQLGQAGRGAATSQRRTAFR